MFSRKKARGKRKPKATKTEEATAPTNPEEDPLLEVEKIHLQRYNPNINEMEYLTQHQGFEIHQSIWLTRTALTGNEKVWNLIFW